MFLDDTSVLKALWGWFSEYSKNQSKLILGAPTPTQWLLAGYKFSFTTLCVHFTLFSMNLKKEKKKTFKKLRYKTTVCIVQK